MGGKQSIAGNLGSGKSFGRWPAQAAMLHRRRRPSSFFGRDVFPTVGGAEAITFIIISQISVLVVEDSIKPAAPN